MAMDGSAISRLASIRAELADIAAAPADAPMAPSGRFYTDETLFRHECETILRHAWHPVCRADEMAENGDYIALNLLGEPLIITRGPDGVRALSNVCRHRGMPLVTGTGNTKRFVCRYHAWTYGLDGALLRAPRMENAGFDPKTCKLGEFRCETRFGYVYVTLSNTPTDLDEDLAGLAAVISPYDPEAFRTVYSAFETWNCNWKCLVENFMEAYHLSVVHPVTLHGYTPTGLSKKGPDGAGFTSYFANYPSDIPSRGSGAPGLTDEQRQRSSLFAVFPGQVASIASTLLVSFCIRPVAVDQIEVRWSAAVYGDELDEDTIRQRIDLWTEVNREDREKLEAMQIALGSVHATGGPLAGPDYEGTVHAFLLWCARRDAALG